MKEFYRTRLAKHQTKLLRYLKYVLNDHIVLIGSFIFGGAALYYADAVKGLDSHFILGKPLIALIWFSALFAGSLATLIQAADKVFILPKEKQMPAYFKASFFHSLELPTVFLFIVVGASMPLLIPVAQATVVDFIFYFLLLLSLKISQLLQQGQDFLQNNQTTTKRSLNLWLVLSATAILVSLYLASWFGLAIAFICLGAQVAELKKATQEHRLDWEKMVATEQQRLKRIYQFINLFTDVPGMSGKVKRRKFFDPLLQRIPIEQKQTYRYLYARSFLRGSEYGQLVVRLTLVGGIMLAFTSGFLLNLLISLIIIYLIGFQLLPLYTHFDYMVMTQLYPLTNKEKQTAFTGLIQTILSVIGFIFALILLVVLPTWSDKLVALLAVTIEILLFSRLYAPSRLKKIDQR